MNRLIIIALFVIGILTISAVAVYAVQRPAPRPPIRNLVYCSDGETLSIYFPNQTSFAKPPLIIIVPGGGWFEINPPNFRMYPAAMLNAGYILAEINYSLAPKTTWPAPLDDLTCAYNYLQTNAQTYGYDASRIALYGESAGGQIVSRFAENASNIRKSGYRALATNQSFSFINILTSAYQSRIYERLDRV